MISFELFPNRIWTLKQLLGPWQSLCAGVSCECRAARRAPRPGEHRGAARRTPRPGEHRGAARRTPRPGEHRGAAQGPRG